MSTIIKNALILTMEESAPVKQGDIVIENGRFAQVGGMAQVKDGDEVIEAGHHVAMPGFVNAHAHSPMTLLRGVGDDLPLDRWLTEAIFPLEANLQDGDCYWGTMAAAAEMIAGGTVLFLEMYQAADEIAKATAESGMRGLITRGVAFRAEDEAAAMGRIKRLENEYDDRYVVESQGRVQYAMGPHAEYTCTPEFLAYCAKYAKERGWRLHIHCSETAKEHAECIERHGKTPVALFESLGMLDVPALFAHCVYITEEDMEILARHGAAVCHCPESNLKLGSGIAPVVKMREKGVLVGIGTDGAASNNDLDMLSECRTAALLQKGANRDAAAITAFEALKMATVDGRKALGVEGGPILEGEVADLILLDVQKAHLTPFGDDPYAAVLYGAKSSDVVLTMVDGNVLYRDGEWKTLCMETIAQEVKRVREGLLSR